MTKQPYISVITINKNNADGLRRTIESVINQSCIEEIQYVVIDGNSTDGSIDVIKKYSSKIDYWISEPDSGIYDAMNKGIMCSNGKYALFLNSGDWLINENIIEDAMLRNAMSDILIFRIFTKYKHFSVKSIFLPSPLFDNYFFSKYFVPHQGTLILTDLLKESGGFDKTYKIIADLIMLHKLITLWGKTVTVYSSALSVVDGYGISSFNGDSLINEKKRYFGELEINLTKIKRRYFPNYLIFDLKNVFIRNSLRLFRWLRIV